MGIGCAVTDQTRKIMTARQRRGRQGKPLTSETPHLVVATIRISAGVPTIREYRQGCRPGRTFQRSYGTTAHCYDDRPQGRSSRTQSSTGTCDLKAAGSCEVRCFDCFDGTRHATRSPLSPHFNQVSLQFKFSSETVTDRAYGYRPRLARVRRPK